MCPATVTANGPFFSLVGFIYGAWWFTAGVNVVASEMSVGSSCLARETDDLWYRATVVDLLDDARYHVMFDLSQREAKLDANELFPLPLGTAYHCRVSSHFAYFRISFFTA